jgi:hypothetical protein
MRVTSFPVTYLSALISLGLLASCGGGSSQNGSTVPDAVAVKGLSACVDVNQNLQCDDGDISRSVANLGTVGLVPSAQQQVLIEAKNSHNQRTQVWMSVPGSATVNAVSTVQNRLLHSGQTPAQISALEAALQSRHGDEWTTVLQSSLALAQQNQALTLAQQLDNFSLAVLAQGQANPVLLKSTMVLGVPQLDVSWSSQEAATATASRQLVVQGSQVLSHSESNRLYLFDASASAVEASEIDVVPPAPPRLAAYSTWVRRSVAGLEKLVSMVVDTASAATAFVNPPTPGAVPVLPSGKGITQLGWTDQNASSALVNINMLSGKYTSDDCASTLDGDEGLFKVSRNGPGSARWLGSAPACVHSGFTLLATDPTGRRVAAWDTTTSKLWVLDANTLQRLFSTDLKLGAPPQALATTPGGNYVAAATAGRLALLDLRSGVVVSQLTGAWADVSQIAFAGGGTQVLLASGHQVHSVSLDNALRLIDQTVTNVAPPQKQLRALSVSGDGDSFVATTDAAVYWHSTATASRLAEKALPPGLAVQQAQLAGNTVVVLARGGQDQIFKLMRLPLQTESTTP